MRFPFYDGRQWTGASDYVALIVRPESTQPQFVVLGEANALENDPLRDYRRRAGLSEGRAVRGVKAAGVETETKAAAPTTSFYQAFWKPLEPALGSARRVYVSTDGVLNQVALGVVPDAAGQLLMEKYDLRLVSSTKDVLRRRSAPTGHTAVVMGNPLFDLDEVQQRVAVRALQQTAQADTMGQAEDAATAKAVSAAGVGQRSRDLRGGALTPLPGTQTEAETVSALLKEQHWDVGLYTGENALEERVKRVQSPRVLHLATHGFFESDQARTQKDLARGPGAERDVGAGRPHAAVGAVPDRSEPHARGQDAGGGPGRRRVDGVRSDADQPARDGAGGAERVRDGAGGVAERRGGVRAAAGLAGSRRRHRADEHVVGAGPRDAGTDDAVLPELARGERHARSAARCATRAARDGQGALRSRPALLLGRLRPGGALSETHSTDMHYSTGSARATFLTDRGTPDGRVLRPSQRS